MQLPRSVLREWGGSSLAVKGGKETVFMMQQRLEMPHPLPRRRPDRLLTPEDATSEGAVAPQNVAGMIRIF